MYCRSGNAASDAAIGYIEPITTGAPLRFDAAEAEPDAPDDAADDPAADAGELELLAEHAETAAASATHAKPAARRRHLFVAIAISPPYVPRVGTLTLSGHS
jgi:hypothetical protein